MGNALYKVLQNLQNAEETSSLWRHSPAWQIIPSFHQRMCGAWELGATTQLADARARVSTLPPCPQPVR